MRTEGTIYLDYQASTPLDPAVLRQMLPFFSESFANPHSTDHSAGWAAEAAIQVSREKISKFIRCDPDEIIFTSGATEANNLAILGMRKQIGTRKRRKIVTSPIEHKSTLAACSALADEHGAEILFCNVDQSGLIDIDHLYDLLSEEVLLMTFGGINSEIGSVQNVEEICCLAARHGVLVHVDGAQMPSVCDVSQVAAQAAMMSLSGHKMYGPKGIGCLYVERGLQRDMAPIVFGGGQQNGVRSGTLPVPLCVGMGAAAEIAGKPAERHAIQAKARKLWDALRAVDNNIILNGPAASDRHPGNLNVRFPGIDADDLLGALQPHLAAATGSACTSGTPEASYVLRGIGLTEAEARSSIRFSLGRFTTDEEIERAAILVGAALRRVEAAGMTETV